MARATIMRQWNEAWLLDEGRIEIKQRKIECQHCHRQTTHWTPMDTIRMARAICEQEGTSDRGWRSHDGKEKAALSFSQEVIVPRRTDRLIRREHSMGRAHHEQD